MHRSHNKTDQCIQAPYWLSSTSRVLETGWRAGSGMISEQGAPQIRQNQTSHTVASLVKKTSPARLTCSAQLGPTTGLLVGPEKPFPNFPKKVQLSNEILWDCLCQSSKHLTNPVNMRGDKYLHCVSKVIFPYFSLCIVSHSV